MYDCDKDGFVTFNEMYLVTSAIYEMIGEQRRVVLLGGIHFSLPFPCRRVHNSVT